MNYDTLANKEIIDHTIAKLKENGFDGIFLETGAEAMEKIKEMIPVGVSVMNGSSTTLQQIGFIDYLKTDQHGWNNLHAGIVNEKDPTKQKELRKSALSSDYYLGSAHALTEEGEIVIASASGSQLPHLAFSSQNIILVVGVQKIVPTLSDALERVEKYVFPLEDARMKSTGAPGSMLAKMLILKREAVFMGRKFTVIFVNEKLGF